MRKKWLLLVSSSLITLLFGEGLLQLYYHARIGRWLWEETAFHVGYTQPVGDRRQYSLRPGYVDKALHITVNRWGFRGPLLAPKQGPFVALLGDSVPFGAGVADTETYPAHLDALFRERGCGVRALNAGVPSYNMRQSFDRLRIDVVGRYGAPFIATLQAANDISLLTQFRQAYNPDLTWADVRWRKTWKPLLPAFFKLATLHYAYRAVFGRHYMPSLDGGAKEQHRRYPADKMLANVKLVLEEGCRFCQDHSITLVLMPIDPFYYQTKNVDKNKRLRKWPVFRAYAQISLDMRSQFNQLLIDASRNHPHVFFFDTRAILDELDREDMYVDFIHYSPRGTQIVARGLYDFLLEHHLLPKAPQPGGAR